jgi:RNA polymerase sigma-70 factor (ECF subfamily)
MPHAPQLRDYWGARSASAESRRLKRSLWRADLPADPAADPPLLGRRARPRADDIRLAPPRPPRMLRAVDSPPPDQSRWFAEEVQPHAAMLRAWLVNTFGPRLSVDDVMQEAYLRVLRAQANGQLHAPKAFLFATARNLALDQLRRHAVSRTGSLVETDLSNVLDDHDSIPETVARSQEHALLTEAIQSLPTRCRQVMTLRIVYGLSQRVIGEKLGISDRTVAAQLAIGTGRCTEFMLRRAGSRTSPR